MIYQDAILMVTSTEGPATAAQASDVTLWEPPVASVDRGPDELLDACIEGVLTRTDASRR
jgi:hypothetical protein